MEGATHTRGLDRQGLGQGPEGRIPASAVPFATARQRLDSPLTARALPRTWGVPGSRGEGPGGGRGDEPVSESSRDNLSLPLPPCPPLIPYSLSFPPLHCPALLYPTLSCPTAGPARCFQVPSCSALPGPGLPGPNLRAPRERYLDPLPLECRYSWRHPGQAWGQGSHEILPREGPRGGIPSSNQGRRQLPLPVRMLRMQATGR